MELDRLHRTLNDSGFDQIFRSVYNLENHPAWVRSFQDANQDHYNRSWYNTTCNKYSLYDYIRFKNKPHLENYLLDKLDFYGVSLKFKARSNTLPLNGRVASWHNSKTSGLCDLCHSNNVEDIRHFIFYCRVFNDIRSDEFKRLEQSLERNGLSYVWELFISSNIDEKLFFLLGGDFTQFLPTAPSDLVHTANVCFDVTCKSLLKRTWKARNDFLK